MSIWVFEDTTKNLNSHITTNIYLVREIKNGWSDSNLSEIGGGTNAQKTQMLLRLSLVWLWYYVRKWTLSLTQSHKTVLKGEVCILFIYIIKLSYL